MKCRSCGAEIAANALICYKCGAATEEPKVKPPARRKGMTGGTLAGLVLLGLALAAVARQVACGSLL
jgi:hypothetical protein